MQLVALVLAFGYLLGSLPFSYVVARFWGIRDVREVGSGNVGASNVMRSAGKVPGVLAFCLDFVKGALAVLAVRHWAGGDEPLAALTGVAAVAGHMYPFWIGFRGGKGVATGAGAFLPVAPLATGLALLAFPVTLALTRYVCLASIAGALTLAAAAFALGEPRAVAWTATAMAALIVLKHRSNLARLRQGTENRLGQRRGA